MKWVVGDVTLIQGKHGSVFVQRRSPISNKMHTMCLNGPTMAQLSEWLSKKMRREPHELVQNAFPTLNNGEREFLFSGITPEEWADKITNDEELENGE